VKFVVATSVNGEWPRTDEAARATEKKNASMRRRTSAAKGVDGGRRDMGHGRRVSDRDLPDAADDDAAAEAHRRAESAAAERVRDEFGARHRHPRERLRAVWHCDRRRDPPGRPRVAAGLGLRERPRGPPRRDAALHRPLRSIHPSTTMTVPPGD